MEKSGQWRYTPPTHVVAAFLEALRQHEAEGGVGGRGGRYTRNRDVMVEGMRSLGFEMVGVLPGIGYTGPAFGYWRIPDQAAIALLHAHELAGEPHAAGGTRRPRFIVFPTLGTHAPFRPLAPFLRYS